VILRSLNALASSLIIYDSAYPLFAKSCEPKGYMKNCSIDRVGKITHSRNCSHNKNWEIEFMRRFNGYFDWDTADELIAFIKGVLKKEVE